MQKTLRIRQSKDTAQTLLYKLMPLILMALIFMLTSTVGVASDGPMGSGID